MKKILLMTFVGLLACAGNKATTTDKAQNTPKPTDDKPTPTTTPEKPTTTPDKPTDTTTSQKQDTVATSKGDLTIVPITHGTVLFQFGGKNLYVDPWSKGNYEGKPKADLILITDIHQDHFDPPAIDNLKTDK